RPDAGATTAGARYGRVHRGAYWRLRGIAARQRAVVQRHDWMANGRQPVAADQCAMGGGNRVGALASGATKKSGRSRSFFLFRLAAGRWSGVLLRCQLAQDVVQDAAVAEILHFLRSQQQHLDLDALLAAIAPAC